MPSKGGKDSPGLSQEQMLWGVLALLCTAVVCFAAGILVNKIQSKPEVASKETGQVERLPGAKEIPGREARRQDDAKGKAGESTTAEGVQVSPAPVVLPSQGSKETAPPSRPVTQREQNTQFVPAPPPQRDDKNSEKKDETGKPMQEPPAAPAPSADAPKPIETAMQTTTTPAPESAPITPATEEVTSAAVPKGGFTIQVGAFDTMESAEKYKNAIERKSDYEVVLYPVKDSKTVKACIGSFDTKEAAAKEREELDRIKDFKGCFVKALSEL